ncbi:MAG: hypothetical protein N2C14_12135, partial [Planctomycetales bacterium]
MNAGPAPTADEPNELDEPSFDDLSIDDLKVSYRKAHPIAWWTSLLTPFAATAAILVALGLVYGWGFAGQLVFAAGLTFFILGRFVILLSNTADADVAAAEGMEAVSFLDSGQLFLLVTYMDFMCALFVSFHMNGLFKIPLVGSKLEGLADD